MTNYGNIKYTRRYYRNKKTKEYVYLADEKMGIEKNVVDLTEMRIPVIENGERTGTRELLKNILYS